MQTLKENFSLKHESNPYVVFVAGLPATVDEGTVLKYFSDMGPVQKLELLKIGKKTRSKGLPKKFYKLTTCSSQLFSLLVSKSCPEFNGRRLFCQEYKNGDDLAFHSADINSRRIVIKKVPIDVTDTVLKTVIGQAGGPLEMMYEYKSDIAIKTEYSKIYKTISATFQSSDRVENLIQQGIIVLPTGEVMLIERFLYKRRLAHNTAVGMPLQANSTTAILDKRSNMQSTLPSPNLVGFAKNHLRDNKEKIAQTAITNKVYPVGSQNTTNYVDIWLCHSYKPTSVKYHYSAQSPMLSHHRDTPKNMQLNLRFNISKLWA